MTNKKNAVMLKCRGLISANVVFFHIQIKIKPLIWLVINLASIKTFAFFSISMTNVTADMIIMIVNY